MNADLLQGFYLGEWLVEPLKKQVSGPAGTRPLPPKAAEVLLCLALSPGELVTRDALLEQVWGQGQGSPEALSHAVSEIRHACDDHHDAPHIIQTLPKRGYRLLIEPRIDAPVPGPEPEIASRGMWSKLLRHGVVQASVAYLVAGWLMIQIADTTFANLGLPPWAERFVTFTVIGGFPLLILLTWFLEFAGGKVERDEGEHTGSIFQGLERNYLAILIAYVVAAAGAGIYHATVGFGEFEPPAVVASSTDTELIPVDKNSLGVLKLLNIDGDAKTQAFSDGLSEDILDALARIPGLYVSARGDSWSLPPNVASDMVRRRLRVASYIEGSVRFSGEHLRVVIQLIDSKTGFHMFSRAFELKVTGIGEMQKEVTSLVVSNLKLAVDPEFIENNIYYTAAPSEDAYYLYMMGREAMMRPRSAANITEAIDYYDQVLLIDNNYPAAHAGRCAAFTALYVLRRDTDNIALAEDACSSALAVAPHLPLVLNSVAQLYLRTGRSGDAESLFTKVLQINEQDASALQGLALIRRRDRRFDEAEGLMQRAVEVQPGNWTSINSLGNMYFRMGRYTEAIEEYRKVVFLDPENFVTLGNLASANLMTGRFVAARDALQQSINIEENETFYANLGIAHYYLGDFDAAIVALRTAIDLAPKSSAAWIGLADALTFAGQHEEAAAAYGKVIALSRDQLSVDAEDVESLTFMAWSSAMTGERHAARMHVQRAVELDPVDPYSHYYDALVKLKQGDRRGSIDSIEKAVSNGYPVAMLAAEPILRELRNDSRFARIIAMDGIKGE